MPTYYDANGNVVTDPSLAVVAIDSAGNAVQIGGGTITPVVDPSISVGAGTSSGFSLSGFGSLLSSIAQGVASGYRAVTGSGVTTINPATGQPYTTAQLQALAQRNAAMQGGGSLLPLAIVAILIVLLLRK